MDIFTLDDLEQAFVHAVDLHRRLQTLKWLGVIDPDEVVEEDLTMDELRVEAEWARMWVGALVVAYGQAHRRSPLTVMGELQEKYLPDGWDDPEDEFEEF